MSLFKPPGVTYWTKPDPKCDRKLCKKRGKCTGHRVKPTEAKDENGNLRLGYCRKKEKAAKWYGRIRYPDGRVKRVPLHRDKTAAQAMLTRLLTGAEREEEGLTDPYQAHRRRPLAEHLDDFKKDLAAKGCDEYHVQVTHARAKAIVEACKFTRWADIAPTAVVQYLAERRQQGLSIQTSNHYLTAIKQFARWMVRERRAPESPLVHLSRQNAKLDVRRKRRILEPQQFQAFIAAAREGEPFNILTGHDRETLYLFAAHTGLRESELASLTPEAFALDAIPPTVTLKAAYSKHRREDTLPLRPDVADMMREYLADKPAGEAFWRGSWTDKGAIMVRMDLAAAGIPYQDEDGAYFDFHSLRHQFISNLAAAGVHPKVAQTLARHSTITLTMDAYSHMGMVDMTGALEKLPSLPPQRPAAEAGRLRATGTDDAPACPERLSGLSPACRAGAVQAGLVRSSADDTQMSNPAKDRTKPQTDATKDIPDSLRNHRLGVRIPPGVFFCTRITRRT
jgi:integrase